jgi:hypothetical protein
MASPRVFVSSTCYDLADERDGLVGFCSAFGFDVALSERGDVFYHPDLHTHTACVRETSNCHIFVLVIGGRFGGKYVVDKTKSITNAEYVAAREQGLPIFTFVKQDVLNDHNVWQRNKDKPFASDILYPSIDKQEYAVDIFQFIDQVRLSPTNNGFFGFRLSKEIFDFLRKQWAGMFHEYLQTRALSRQLSATNETLATLAAASEKIEEIVKGIYKNVDATGATAALDTIDLEGQARELFITIAARTEDRRYLHSFIAEHATQSPPPEWHAFFVEFGFFRLTEGKDDDGTPSLTLTYYDESIAKLTGSMTKLQRMELGYFQERYDAYLKLPPSSRVKLIEVYIYDPPNKTAA